MTDYVISKEISNKIIISVGSSLKSVVWLPLLWTRRRPLTTRGIAHSTRTEIFTHSIRISHSRNYIRPTFYLIRISHSRNYIRSTFYLIWISHSRNYIRSTFYLIRISHSHNYIRPTFHLIRISHIRIRLTFHLLQIFHIRHLPLDGRGGRFNFPRQTCPDTLVTLTRTAWLVRRSRFAGSISAHNQKAPTKPPYEPQSWRWDPLAQRGHTFWLVYKL